MNSHTARTESPHHIRVQGPIKLKQLVEGEKTAAWVFLKFAFFTTWILPGLIYSHSVLLNKQFSLEVFFFFYFPSQREAAVAKYWRLQVDCGCCWCIFFGHPIFPLREAIIPFCLKGYRQGPYIISRKPACKNKEFARDQS